MPLVTNPVTIFLVVLGIILIVPLVLQRLKIPYIIGLILAGIAVGPFGFHIVDNDKSFEVFGQVGILYLMFLAGLEIDMVNLRRNISKGLIFGFYTFIVPFVMGVAVARWVFSLGWLASGLLASMFAAHTLLGYPIVSRFGLRHTRASIVAVSGTIVTVIGSLMVLATVGTAARMEGSFTLNSTLHLVASLVLFCAVMIYVYPRLTRWFFKHYMERVTQFIYVLTVTFLAAAVARWIGIEGVFGAFLAGLVLNRYVPARSPLMTRLEFVGNALFIPYFLIGVGMMINLKVLTHGWGTIFVATVMSVVAIFSKWIAAWLGQLTLKMDNYDRSLMFQLTNAHTVVALAVVTIGYKMGLLSEEILNGTVLMILVTCTVSTLGIERSARRLKLRELSNTKDERKEGELLSNTLVTVSNPMTVSQLVDMALLMRIQTKQQQPLYALHVRNDISPNALEAARTSLELAEKAASAVDTEIELINRYDNNVITGIANTIAERNITDVFIGLHHRGTSPIDSFFGLKLEQLVKATNRMIVVNRCFIPLNTISRILVYVPEKAEFETGFQRWVESLDALAGQLACRLVFWCFDSTHRAIKALNKALRKDIRVEFRLMDAVDDYVLLSKELGDEDLFVVVSARRASVSFNDELDNLPGFIERYLSRNNLVVIYPEQFAPEPIRETLAGSLSADFAARPVPLWRRIKVLWQRRVRNRHHRNQD